MREIKFRMWNGQQMQEVANMHFNEDGIETNYLKKADFLFEDGLPVWDLSKTEKPTALMQYTGLKDKNGKEIYEGDIVKDESGATGEVKWDDKDASFLAFSKEDGGVCWNILSCSPETIEVIGNVYENIDLLGGIDCNEK